MKNALIIEEQIHQKQKPQEQLHLSPPSTPLPLEQQQKLGNHGKITSIA
jgi:hypothetical protein